MTISEECSIGNDGCTMCSDSLHCEHGCHKIHKGQTAYHRCDNNDCLATVDSVPFCSYTPDCSWQDMTCPVCGIGKIKHSSE